MEKAVLKVIATTNVQQLHVRLTLNAGKGNVFRVIIAFLTHNAAQTNIVSKESVY